MIIWVTLVVVVIIVIVAASIAFGQKKKENKALVDEIFSLKLQVKNLEQDKESQDKLVEFLRELIFFSHLGYKPSKDEKLKMMGQLLDNMEYITTIKSKNSLFRTERALIIAGHLNVTGKELNDIFDSLRNLLSESIAGNRSLYPQLTDYIYYCGLDFCGKKEMSRAEIKEWGNVVNFGHVDE